MKDARSEAGVVFFVTGIRHQITLHVDLASGKLTYMTIREHGHVEYVRYVARADFFIKGAIRVVWGASDEAVQLVEFLLRRAQDEDVLSVSQGPDLSVPVPSEARPVSEVQQSTAEMWRVMAELEGENATSVTLRTGAVADPEDGSRLLAPYDLDIGTLDFNDDEEVNVL